MSDDDDNDDDFASHAADEPTAMWGGDMLQELGLDKAPSEPPKGPAQPSAESKGTSVQVTLASPQDGAKRAQRKKPAPRSQAVQWAGLIIGALALAAAAFYLVRALR